MNGAMTLTAEQLSWMPVYYLITVAVELSVLWFALSRRYSSRSKWVAGFWLTACTYPILWLVLPPFFDDYWTYMAVGETLVPLIECGLFWAVFIRPLPPNRLATRRDMAAVVAANVSSFLFGLLVNAVLVAAEQSGL